VLTGTDDLRRGPYPMMWAVLALYEHPANARAPPTSVAGAMLKAPRTGVDSSTAFTLTFAAALRAQAVLSCSLTLPDAGPAGATLRCRGGTVRVHAPLFCPPAYTVQWFDAPGSGRVVREETRVFAGAPGAGGGRHYEADEVARCVRDGRLESDVWGHDKSLLLMDVFDAVRRAAVLFLKVCRWN
jgi:hypothetical protein